MASKTFPVRSIARVVSRATSIAPRQHAAKIHIARNARWTPSSRIAQRQAFPPLVQRRRISDDAELKPTEKYDFEKVKQLAASPPSPSKAILIDVREPHEVQAGYIPGSINLPIQSQPDALFLNEEEFEDRFGFEKPKPTQEVVFYCKAGVRSKAAAQFAVRNGYTKVSEYPGSYMDWIKKGGEVAGGK